MAEAYDSPVRASRSRSVGPHWPTFGTRLRRIRTANGIGLRELARRVGRSPGFLSQHGMVAPSVGTLYALRRELGVPMDELLASRGRARLKRPAGAGAASEVVRASERRQVSFAAGVTWPSWPATRTVSSSGRSRTSRGPSRRPRVRAVSTRAAFGVVLEGSLTCEIGGEKYVLEPGDSIAFDASLRHCFSNNGTTVARALWSIHRTRTDADSNERNGSRSRR